MVYSSLDFFSWKFLYSRSQTVINVLFMCRSLIPGFLKILFCVLVVLVAAFNRPLFGSEINSEKVASIHSGGYCIYRLVN